MGLDMYLIGEHHIFSQDVTEHDKDFDWPLTGQHFEIAYWRKFAPLHYYILENFADGNEDCRRVDLNSKDCLNIANALTNSTLPKNDDCGGFFFGNHEIWDEWQTENKQTAATFKNASKWLNYGFRSIIYHASW